jgi:uncharacterized protein
LSGAAPGVLAVLATVAFIGGLARGFSGFGTAMIFVPVAGAAIGPVMAAPVLILMDGIGSLPLLPPAWRNGDRAAVLLMSAGALCTVPVGAWLLTRSNPIALRWGVCVTILGLVGLLASGWRYRLTPHRAVTAGVGVISGLLTGVAQIGGPPAVAYWLGGASESGHVRANMVLFLALSELQAAVIYGFAGLFSLKTAILALVCGPAFVLGLLLGRRMFGLAAPATFRRVCYGLITVAAIVGMPLFR